MSSVAGKRWSMRYSYKLSSGRSQNREVGVSGTGPANSFEPVNLLGRRFLQQHQEIALG